MSNVTLGQVSQTEQDAHHRFGAHAADVVDYVDTLRVKVRGNCAEDEREMHFTVQAQVH